MAALSLSNLYLLSEVVIKFFPQIPGIPLKAAMSFIISSALLQDAAKESRMKVAGLLEELVSLLEKRSSFVALYDSEIDKFKSSRDTGSFTNALKKINADYSAANAKVLSHQSELGREDRDLADKVSYRGGSRS